MAASDPPLAITTHSLPSPPTPKTASFARLLDTKCYHSLHHLQQTHAQLVKNCLHEDNYIAGSLVKHYSNPSFQTFGLALKVFDQVPKPHVFLWNSLIRACIDNNCFQDAIFAYRCMVLRGSIPNKYTYPFVLKACTMLEAFKEGIQCHADLVKRGLGSERHIVSAAIQMYAAAGMVTEARRMLTGSDPVCWNAMINGYMKNGEIDMARELFDAMPCKNTGSWNAMITGYARNGMIDDSSILFDKMPRRNEVSWSAIIDGYVQCGCFADALEIFQRMLNEGVALEKFVLPSVLAACASVGALEQGRWIHAYANRNLVELDPVLGTSLVDMYAKCGRLDLAADVFDQMRHKEVFSWNAMIGAFAIHGHTTRAIELFSQMQMAKVKPNAITFIGLLNACAHAGLVNEGRKYFASMEKEFRITPLMEHYGCMVDLLGRAGLFSEAESMINSMPMNPNAAVWGALLGACRIHGNIELGERVGELLLELEPDNSGRYILLSNIYARAGRWDDASRVRKLMKDRGISTTPGISLVELDGVVHEFKAGDGTHREAKEINLMLEEMLDRLKLEGYAANISWGCLFDIDE